VVLINGEELVALMIDHGVGVEPVKVATINRINEDFFEEL
jgi:restriction system protein